jgi:acid stress chaperone HdeB
MNPKRAISIFMVSSLIFGASLLSPSQAQDKIDASKITCEDYIFYKVSNPDAITDWLSGYYHGKRNNPIVDPQLFEANVNKVRNYCQQTKNYILTIMQVIEQTLGTDK